MQISRLPSRGFRIRRSVRPRSGGRRAWGIFAYLALLAIPALVVFALTPPQLIFAQGPGTSPGAGSAMNIQNMKCEQAVAAMSAMQTPVPVTPAPTNTPGAAASNPTPAAPPPPTPTLRPAPDKDNVGFPKGWENYAFIGLYDRGTNGLVRAICFNDVAASIKPGDEFPYGSVVAMISWRAKMEAGHPVLDETGHMIRESLFRIEAMKKEKGLGEAYKEFRSGEWEYGAYNPDGSLAVQPQATGSCAACHSAGSNEAMGYTFFAARAFQGMQYRSVLHASQSPVTLSHIVSMGLAPNNITVKPGTIVVFDNQDFLNHSITARDGSFDSGPRTPGSTFSTIFDKPGTFAYFCSLHPAQMTGTITVKD